jgi:hypothetical protein
MLRSRWVRGLIVTSLIGTAVVLPATGTGARTTTPSLRLWSVLNKVTAVRYGTDKHLYFSPGAYLAADGGAFEMDATRGSDGTIALWQVSRDAKGVHQLRQIVAPSRAQFGAGLPRFLHLVITDARGSTVLTRDIAMCPNGNYGQSRVDASGPDSPTFPYDCGGPLTHAAVWGIDEGWATQLSLGFVFRPADGTYNLDVSIAPTYASQLQIPDADTHVKLALVVQTQKDGGCGIAAFPCPVASRPGIARPGVTQAPAAGTAGAAAAVLQKGSGLPDMRALPAHDLSITHSKRNGHDYLNFGATIWNAGSGPLVVEGFRTGSAEVMNATQFIYQNGQPTSSQVVGQFEYDHRRGHNHWHMEDIAQYDLLDQSGNRVLLSGKQSFCLAPTDSIDLTLPGAAWQPDQASLWSACAGEESIWLREVLPAGWGDTYFQSVAGQSFDITGQKDGHYQVRVTTDPADHLLESDYTNNVGLLPITLGGTPGHRTLRLG